MHKNNKIKRRHFFYVINFTAFSRCANLAFSTKYFGVTISNRRIE